jgi:hypothetical protein
MSSGGNVGGEVSQFIAEYIERSKMESQPSDCYKENLMEISTNLQFHNTPTCWFGDVEVALPKIPKSKSPTRYPMLPMQPHIMTRSRPHECK